MNINFSKPISLLVFLLIFVIPVYAQVTYVSPTGTGSGTSWADAQGDLKAVLDAATFGDQIWVQEGTYYPVTCTACTISERNESFVIKDGVRLYGGFQGWESTLDQRDWVNNITILSGDINQDNQPDSNAYSVVYSLNCSAATLVDGLTIAHGNADSDTGSNASKLRSGGGWYNEATSISNPVIRNVIFESNFAISSGGGLLNNGSSSSEASPFLENCQFRYNECLQNGGAMFNDSNTGGASSPEILDCLFLENEAKYGAGVYNSGLGGTSNSAIVRCSFIGNEASAYSGAIYNFGKSGGLTAPLISNCLFYNNKASSAGAIYSLGSGGTATPQIINCTFYANDANTGGAVYCNESTTGFAEVNISNCIFWNNTAGFDPTFHMSGSGSPKMILSHSLIDADDCDDIMALGALDTLVCGPGMIYDQDPMFVDIAGLNFRLQTVSPAINEGDNDVVSSNNILLDMDNHVRIHNELVDFGVYEFGSQPYQAPTITQQPSDLNVCEGNDNLFSISVDGTAPFEYQWFKDGVALSGAISNNLSFENIQSIDEGDYNCRVISIFSDTIQSNPASMVVAPELSPGITVTASLSAICQGEAVTFTANVEEEGDSPEFEWKVNGQVVFTGAASYTSSNLNDGDEINCRLTSSEACANPVSINSSGVFISVAPQLTAAVLVEASATQICEGEEVVFTASPVNGGNTPNFQWTVDGQPAGTNSPVFTSSDLEDGASVICQLTSSEVCAIPATASSTPITVEVENQLLPAVTISSGSTEICAGDELAFSAVAENGGTNPVFEWFVNGQATGNTSAAFSTNTLEDGASVTCIMTSSASCVSAATANSNSIEITVNPVETPLVEVTASTLEICAGEPITFTANVTNEGANPTYVWYIDGQAQNENSPEFSTENLLDNSEVYCQMSSSMACASPASPASDILVVSVSDVVEPTVLISSSELSICSGQMVSFSASATNEGLNPVFEWTVNGQPVGTNSPDFSSATLTDGAMVVCQLISSEGCVSAAQVNSNTLELEVTDTVLPAVQITANVSEICAGEAVTFTASMVNEGADPVFEWLVDGQSQNNNDPVFLTTSLTDGAVVSCTMTSSATCASQSIVTSNDLTLEVAEVVTPAVTISSNADTYCSGELATFTALAVNGGASPTYEWSVDGMPVGTNEPEYSSTTLSDGVVVECQLISSSNCASPAQVFSNSIELQVLDNVTPSVSIEADQSEICAGTLVSFEASTEFEGSMPHYQWFVNGVDMGLDNPVFQNDLLNDSDTVSCTLVSSEACASSTMVTSEPVIMEVTENLSLLVQITVTDTIICLGDSVTFTAITENEGIFPTFQWLLNGNNTGVDNNEFSSGNLADGDQINCMVSSSESCIVENDIISDPVMMEVDSCIITVTKEAKNETDIRIFPNPTSGLITINLNQFSEPLKLVLFDVQGRQMELEGLKTFTPFNSYSIDLSMFPSGVYFLHLVGLYNTYQAKIILKK